MNLTKNYIDQNSERFLNELKSFLSIPSVSADAKFKADIQNAADFLCGKLQDAGMEEIKQFSYDGNPIVYAEKITDRDLPTLLIYGHYDVQPADPIELWESPPFEPSVREGKIFARGACDDKAQVFLIVKALELLNHSGNFPCNIKIVFEGEEETGSASLYKFVEDKKELLKADTLLVCDTAMPGLNEPAIITGLRGIVYGEISVTGAPQDLHSGMWGGTIVNPLLELSRILSAFKNEDGKIMIPGFYDGIEESSVNDSLKQKTSSEYSAFQDGEKGFSFYERQTQRPTFDINGISGGYNGEGPKTIIPSSAKAKISFRLACGQNAEDIATKAKKFIEKTANPKIKTEVNLVAACNAVKISTDNFACKAAAESLKNVFGKEPIFHSIGGTIPVVSLFHQSLGVEPLLMGFGLDSDNIHAPNECFHLSNFYNGIETLYLFTHQYVKEFQNTLIHN